jgi:hypothetical protein
MKFKQIRMIALTLFIVLTNWKTSLPVYKLIISSERNSHGADGAENDSAPIKLKRF